MQQGGAKGNREEERETQHRTFVVVNERPVDDISLEFFYKPHTLTLLAVSIIGVMYIAFIRSVAGAKIKPTHIRPPMIRSGVELQLKSGS